MHQSNIQLATNILHINDIPFLTSISNYIHYSTANTGSNMKANTLELGLQNIVRFCAICRFNIVIILVDIQFKSLKNRNKISVMINIMSKGEYIK